ncbi:HNH endonuclease [Amphritea pacifica]|nr:HNH endonuclease [Amphritea pacifica]
MHGRCYLNADGDKCKRLDPENLQSLCHACHNTKTAEERRKQLKSRI